MSEKEYIDRKAFVETQRHLYCENCERRKGMKNGKLYEIGGVPCRACDIDDMLDDVEDFPAADVRPVVRGEWLEPDDDYGYYVCSACGERAPDDEIWNFCPTCGADMRETL